MKYLLGIDFGGGASKATLIDEKGNIIDIIDLYGGTCGLPKYCR